MIEWSIYKRDVDGNVFDWILRASEFRRQLKAQEKFDAIKKASEKSEIMDEPKVED